MIPKNVNIEDLPKAIVDYSPESKWSSTWMTLGLFLVGIVLTDMVTTIGGTAPSITGMLISEYVTQRSLSSDGNIESYRHPILWVCLASQFVTLLLGFALFTHGDRGVLRSRLLTPLPHTPLRLASATLGLALSLELVFGRWRAHDISNVTTDLSWPYYDDVLRPWGWLIGGAVFAFLAVIQMHAVLRRANRGATATVAFVSGSLACLIAPTIARDFFVHSKPYAMGDRELLTFRWWETLILSFLALPVVYAWAIRSRLGVAGVVNISRAKKGVPAFVYSLDFRYAPVPRMLGRFLTESSGRPIRWHVLRVEPSKFSPEIGRRVLGAEDTELTEYRHFVFIFDHDLQIDATRDYLKATGKLRLTQREEQVDTADLWGDRPAYDVKIVEALAEQFASRAGPNNSPPSPTHAYAINILKRAIWESLNEVYALPCEGLAPQTAEVMGTGQPSLGQSLLFVQQCVGATLTVLNSIPAGNGGHQVNQWQVLGVRAQQAMHCHAKVGLAILDAAKLLPLALSKTTVTFRTSLLTKFKDNLTDHILGKVKDKRPATLKTVESILSTLEILAEDFQIESDIDLDSIANEFERQIQTYEAALALAGQGLPGPRDFLETAAQVVQTALQNPAAAAINPEVQKELSLAIKAIVPPLQP